MPGSAIGMLAAGGVLLVLGIVFLVAKLGLPLAIGAMLAGIVLGVLGFLSMGKNKTLAAELESDLEAVNEKIQALDKEREKFLSEHDSEEKIAKLYDKYLKKDNKKKETDEKEDNLKSRIHRTEQERSDQSE